MKYFFKLGFSLLNSSFNISCFVASFYKKIGLSIIEDLEATNSVRTLSTLPHFMWVNLKGVEVVRAC